MEEAVNTGVGSIAKKSTTSNPSNIQNLLSAKINEIEKTGAMEEEEERKFAAATKKQLKEHMKWLDEILCRPDSREEKIKALSIKYYQLMYDNRAQEKELIAKTKKIEELNRTKDTLTVDLNKMTSSKNKMENLCRELQKQNKTAADNNKKVVDDEQSVRSELAKKFQQQLTETTKKQEQDIINLRNRYQKESDLFREKIMNLAEEYSIRQKHEETKLKTKDIENQILEAKLSQQSQQHMQEASQRHQLAVQQEQRIENLLKNERDLKSQLTLYAEKFEQFQETLTKSNDIFNTFKLEMEKMSKTIKKKDKELLDLKKKQEQTDVALINYAEDNSNTKKQNEQLKAQKKKLEELCRAMQSERKTITNGPSTSHNTELSVA
ncbi:hypothetical protein PROFUN_07293 [Planoprotostelium fungivorum]|uniref:Alpha-taxilin n=1 Tax=Planoprotostelium fungivorum TaxID=1890364 RepID=A0A2P6NM16_9EUKA|nr:hypothetical protein PROFUN_07293 [Planoprotostelium fungivorum]